MVKVAFVHPDLGIGGAERLIVDAALALKASGHEVKIFTSHHDPSHCFTETKDGQLDVIAVGDWLPRHLLWKFYAFFAYFRMIYVAFYLVLFSGYESDVIICDQISACIPVLKQSKKSKVIFYCHFPDMLLTQRKSLLKKLYRAPIDFLEETTTGMADVVLVNSEFTAKTFFTTFKSLQHINPVVLYPSLNFDGFDKDISHIESPLENKTPPSTKNIFLSINRYERKKNLDLAIEALNELKEMCTGEEWKSVQLVIAGGYDARVDENKEYYLDLGRLASAHGIIDHVVFLCSFSDEEKIFLLNTATCLLYTPSNEHFGIVPIEAMYMKLPVIAVNSGGPLETIENKVTGYLCEPKPKDFGQAMKRFIDDPSLKTVLGDAGRRRVLEHFSYDSFTRNLHKTVTELVEDDTPRSGCQFSCWKLELLIAACIILPIWYFLF